jgi:uncharacterized membrane protein
VLTGGLDTMTVGENTERVTADRGGVVVVVFLLLFVVFGLLLLVDLLGWRPAWLRSHRAKMRIGLAAMFLLAASGRLVAPAGLLQMIPEFLPFRQQALYLSGIFEVLGALGLLVPRLQRLAGWGLIALLIVVVPANINVALNNLQIEGQAGSPLYQWARVLWQLVLIWLVWWAAELGKHSSPADAPRSTHASEERLEPA